VLSLGSPEDDAIKGNFTSPKQPIKKAVFLLVVPSNILLPVTPLIESSGLFPL
jgi:hypothetical protein